MHGTTSASIIEIIRVIETVGDGREIPARQVISYWTKEGELIARQDTATNGAAIELDRDHVLLGVDGAVRCHSFVAGNNQGYFRNGDDGNHDDPSINP